MRYRFLGLGVAVTGPIAKIGHAQRWTVKWLEAWRTIDHPQFFEDALGAPVWVENDATLAGLAEFYDSGLIQRYNSAIALIIGHGVGGGIVARRDVVRGEFGNAGEIGRFYPMDEPRPSAIDLLQELSSSGPSLGSLLEIEACMAERSDAIDAWTVRVAKQLLAAAIGGVAWLDPGAVIISGSLPIPILESVGKYMSESDWKYGSTPMPTPELYVSRLGSWAASIGAAMLPIHHIIAVDQDF